MASSSNLSPGLFSRILNVTGLSLFMVASFWSSTSFADESSKDVQKATLTSSTSNAAHDRSRDKSKTNKKGEEKDVDQAQPFPSVAEQLAAAKKANAEKEATFTKDANVKNSAADVVKDDPTLPLPPPDDKMSGVIGPFFKSMFMLIVVLGIAWLTLHKGLGKLMTRAQVGKRMQVVEKTSLDQRRSLYLVAVDGKEFILGGGEGGVVFLRDVEPAAPASFSGTLKDAHNDAPISTPLNLPAKENTSNDDDTPTGARTKGASS
ncbi:MAG: FliO/MopB family protein [Deltaproteobacteria bacterium]|nr:FliO/MopB family protein [Deltaproteobacteria bacterium]